MGCERFYSKHALFFWNDYLLLLLLLLLLQTISNLTVNIWKSYVTCGLENEYESDLRRNENTEAAVKIRTKKNSGLYGIWTHDHGDNGVVLYQLG